MYNYYWRWVLYLPNHSLQVKGITALKRTALIHGEDEKVTAERLGLYYMSHQLDKHWSESFAIVLMLIRSSEGWEPLNTFSNHFWKVAIT